MLEGRIRIDAIEQIDALGTTYRATRVADEAPIWLRELPFRRGPDDPGEALEREAKRIAQLEHPALPSWIEHFIRREGRAGALWMVQDQAKGSPLARLTHERVFDEAEVVARLEQLADLLRYLHEQTPAIVHGGISPSSVIEQARLESASEPAGHLLVIGFNAIGTEGQITLATGSGVQTVARGLASMAPEQFFGRAEPATDIWGLGLIGVVLLTGSTPLELRDPDHRLLWRDRVAIDAGLAELLDAMLDRDPNKRPNASQLCKQLARLRRSQRPTLRLPRDEVMRGSDRPAAIAGSIGARVPESGSPTSPAPPRAHTTREPARPIRRARRSSTSEDVPVMRPADLSRELSQAFHATEQLIGRERRRSSAARVALVLAVALITALVLWVALI